MQPQHGLPPKSDPRAWTRYRPFDQGGGGSPTVPELLPGTITAAASLWEVPYSPFSLADFLLGLRTYNRRLLVYRMTPGAAPGAVGRRLTSAACGFLEGLKTAGLLLVHPGFSASGQLTAVPLKNNLILAWQR